MRRPGYAHVFVATTLLAPGCTRSAPADPPAPPASATAAPVAIAPAPSASAKAAGASALETWTGTYTAVRAAYYIPRDADAPNTAEWSGVKQRVEDGGDALLGKGSLTLIVDRATGRVRGTVDGPVGPAVVSGAVNETGVVTATIARKDPTDQGLSGTLLANAAGESLTGTMRLSEWNAVVLREATFDARRASAPPR